MEKNFIINDLQKELPCNLDTRTVNELFFYGAGCIPNKKDVIEDAMRSIFARAKIYVETDLLAAARALLGEEPGFAAILGTGMNSCLYNGTDIIHQISPLGFILGDEGSGNQMGKILLRDSIRGRIPVGLHNKFVKIYHLKSAEILEQIYYQPFPNRFCANFTTFLKDNIHDSYSYNLVRQSFYDFFSKLVSCYPEIRDYSFNCSGSVAYYFKDILLQVVAEFNMQPGKIIQSPIEELLNYHIKEVMRYNQSS